MEKTDGMTKWELAQEIVRHICAHGNLEPIPWAEEELAVRLRMEPWEDLERAYKLVAERPQDYLTLLVLDELVERHRERRM